MNTERGGLLKTRAEDFARHLQTRLRSLREGSDSSWASEDSEVYYDIDSSLASPEEEIAEPIFISPETQNSFPLQRDESSDSQYFDSIENVEDLSPVSSLRKIPILHLKSDSVVINGHRGLLDADSGCSRVHELLSSESELEERENNETICDSDALETNNNEEKDFEEEDVDLGVVSFGITVVSTTTSEENGSPLQKEVQEEAVIDCIEGATGVTDDSFCVFCDIEQMKSSLTNDCEDSGSKHEEPSSNGCCKNNEQENSESGPAFETQINQTISNDSPDTETNISLTDLLQVLKKDIENEVENKKEHNDAETDNSGPSLVLCPCIEIIEETPVIVDPDSTQEEDDDDDLETRRKYFKRSSSLKTGKTPPGTPGRKKIVRFADVLGLDLADVKTFLDEVPTIPKSAFQDLEGVEMSSSPVFESPLSKITVLPPQPEKLLMPLFQQPSVQPNFLDRVRDNNVCLESAYVSDMSFCAISGVVRVKNIDFHKSVYIRYSIDRWRSFSDLQARYVPKSCDGFSDKFSFTLYAHTLTTGQRIEFAIRFHAMGAQYWDSNGGLNYVFECVSRKPPDPGVPCSPMETWASFY